MASLCFRIKWRSRVARVIEDSILENCHLDFSLTFLTEKPWDEFGRQWQVTYFQQIVSNSSLPCSHFLNVIQLSPLKEGPGIPRSGVCVDVFSLCKRKGPWEGFRLSKLHCSKIRFRSCFSLHLSTTQN